MNGQTKNIIAQRSSSYCFNIRHKKQTDGVDLHFSRDDHLDMVDVSIHILKFICLPPSTLRALDLRLMLEKHWIHQ